MLSKKGIGIVVAVSAVACIGLTGFGRYRKTTEVNGIGWYNSLADAKEEAKHTNRPILFLSMFGHIDEDMPCANARTLRATLFKDPAFKKLVTDEVIPAWEMVRPVPKIEIDLGDGNKITRTVRGNAVMYLLNSDGKVIDAFPGIYTAKDFIPQVEETLGAIAHADGAAAQNFHRVRGAVRTGFITMSKGAAESPTLRFIGARAISGTVKPVASNDPDVRKFEFAARGVSDLSLNPMSSREVMAEVDGLTGARSSEAEDPAARGMRILDADSKNNLNIVRPVVHLWLATQKTPPTPEEARDAVLETILKIPYKDPYFGLKDIAVPGTP